MESESLSVSKSNSVVRYQLQVVTRVFDPYAIRQSWTSTFHGVPMQLLCDSFDQDIDRLNLLEIDRLRSSLPFALRFSHALTATMVITTSGFPLRSATKTDQPPCSTTTIFSLRDFHELKINGYSRSLKSRWPSFKSSPFRAGGRSWRILYKPKGTTATRISSHSISFLMTLLTMRLCWRSLR